jgi:hypothetical protein
MMPPTYLTCLEISQHPTPADVLAAAPSRVVDMFTPSVEGTGAEATLSVPPWLADVLEARRA